MGKKGDGTYEKDSVICERNSGCYVLHISERFGAVSKSQNSETEADAERRDTTVSPTARRP
jgi:hypothetical protein